MSEEQKRAVELKKEIESACIKSGFNLTIYDDSIGFVDPKENGIVMLWKPQYKATKQWNRRANDGKVD